MAKLSTMLIPCVQPACDPLQVELPAATTHERRAHRRVTKSRFRLVSTLSAAAQDRLTHPTDATHRAAELSMLQLAAKLM